ncbi:MAG: THUMP domain-containing protein [Candidatus Bathyarchaeota archaeon]|nr:THUMP domain-containing protein [Candidatus Bathyarchaeota archaeon]MDH5778982.1 THUMP domain-containing protein [Candidatus Bathyarchaeota archaeon]
MANLFFLVSGEHPTLPFSELEAILEVEEHKYRISEKLSQVLRIQAPSESIRSIATRSAMTRVCCLELFICDASDTEILRTVRSACLEGVMRQRESFAVRIRRIRAAAQHINRGELERKLGEQILKKVENAKVNLTTPKKTFFGILTENRFVFGLKMAEILPKSFIERRPQRRPFFHPTALSAKLARCMVNLARPKAGELVLDPFCGTASLLVEAGLIGCRVLGFDAQRRMVKGSLRNLAYYGVSPEGMIAADARHLPVKEVDCIVTDPPYGRSATTLGLNTEQIVRDFLSAAQENIPKGDKICIASPKSIRIGVIGKESGLKHVESHMVYVHRGLTREIAVFERN